MDTAIAVLVVAVLIIISLYLIKIRVRKYRARLIDTFTFPKSIADKVRKIYPNLNENQLQQVMRGLREYFHLIVLANGKMVSMPSQVVDVAWHEFILFTKQYEVFCNRALGRFLHHTPAEAMQSKFIAQEGIKRAWRLSCYRQNINPKSPTKLPLLFALDKDLGIQDGFTYELNCDKNSSNNGGGCGGYCAAHIGCSSGCSGSSGSESSAGDGCSGGCGGD
jgi:hypothetical protein